MWRDSVCGNGVCEGPYEFPAFMQFGCEVGCGRDPAVLDVVLVLQVNATTTVTV